MKTIIFFIQLIAYTSTTLAFSTPSNNFLSAIKNLFENNPMQSIDQREELKFQLVEVCNDSSISDTEKRTQVEGLIAQLKDLSPIKETAQSLSLQKKWNLIWTTEKEINFFIDWKISGQITQTLQNGSLENNIPFQKGGFFGVQGKLSISNNDKNAIESDDSTANSSRLGMRTEFEFESATLDLGKWGSFSFPPVGKGWFDTVYLDESFRIDINSRNDILICQSSD